jgi:hypothetical protein
MKKYNTIYYLLFVLLIMGAFASMAQNDYGNTILGVVAFLFAIVFAIQLLSSFARKDSSLQINRFELLTLMTLSIILGLRVFYIYFLWVEYIFGLAGLLLIGVYLKRLITIWSLFISKNKTLAFLSSIFFVSIILYTTSMTLVPFSPMLTEPIGKVAFALLLVFSVGSYLKRNLMVEGERISSFKMVSQNNDHSVVIMALFILFTAYMGLTKINVIPKMYSSELPQAYIELVKKLESGTDKDQIKKTTPEEFKKAYDWFVERN